MHTRHAHGMLPEMPADGFLQVDLDYIVTSDNPDLAYADVGRIPGRAQEILEYSESVVAHAGADLETGFRYKREKVAYEASFDAYQVVLGLASKKLLREHPQLTQREEFAKRDVIQFIADSTERIIESDVHKRLLVSRIERAKERVARTNTSLKLGQMALGGASGMMGAVTYKAFEIGPGELLSNIGAARASIGTVVLVGLLGLARAGTLAGRERIKNFGIKEIEAYAAERGVTDATLQTAPERIAHCEVEAAREALSVISLDTDISATRKSDTFVDTLMTRLDTVMDDFYHLEAPKPKVPLKTRIAKLLRISPTT